MANVYGIDVSEHNSTLDWTRIKAAGIKFAIIRSGYGVSHEDTQFQNNMKGALAQGIPVGVYHFSYALNAEGAKNEAAFVAKLLAPYKAQITLPVFFDFEYDTVSYAAKQGVTLGKQAFNDHTVAFCEAIEAAGYTPGVYYNLDYKNRFVDDDMVGDYVQWYAQYNTTASWNGWDLWQYSSEFTINGLSGSFDANVAPESFLSAKPSVEEGWQENDNGRWFQHADGSWPTAQWQLIGGEYYYFDAEGYMVTNQIVDGAGSFAGYRFYCGSDGKVVTDSAVMVAGVTYQADAAGRLSEGEEGTEMFTDVKSDAWYAEAVAYCAEKDLMQGTGDGKFEPDKALNRAQAAVIMMRLHKMLTE